jgi:hypothetical protein
VQQALQALLQAGQQALTLAVQAPLLLAHLLLLAAQALECLLLSQSQNRQRTLAPLLLSPA